MNKKIIIGIVGFGNIGGYFYNTLQKNLKNISIKTGKTPIVKYISCRNPSKKRKFKLPKSKWIKNPLSLVSKKDLNIVIELIGGADGIAKKVVFNALKNKKHVVTANKSLISKHGDMLAFLAEKKKVNLEYEASVAAGVPIIRSIKEGLIANKIKKIYGILNGTTNYILSLMENSNKSFGEALNIAKEKGYAESNPSSDLNGCDAASKIRILSSIAFNKQISKNNILTEGIQNISLTDISRAKALGYKIKLLAISEIINNKLIERVHPCMVATTSYIANIDDVQNAIVIDGFPIGRSILQGEGAGPGPTTSALISDLCSILRGNVKYPFGVSASLRKNINEFKIYNHLTSSYLRLEVNDKPGVLSSITKIFAKYKISIMNLVQLPDKTNKKASIIIITHESYEKNFSKLISSLIKNKFVLHKPTFIRIEKV